MTPAERSLAGLRDFVERMERGEYECSPEQLALADKALASLKAREGEDIEEWARKLTEDAADW